MARVHSSLPAAVAMSGEPARWNVDDYGSPAAALLTPEPLCALGPGAARDASRAILNALSPEALFAGRRVAAPDMARCCLAGLWLLHDHLEESHAISQGVASREGSYWHAIMHRREPDASNAAYWFRRVGQHPVFVPLAREAANLGLTPRGAAWNPYAFIDLCERHRGDNSEHEQRLRRVQQWEWRLLFDWCYRRAVGETTPKE